MTSFERREGRYKRRKKKREDKVLEESNYYADVNRVFCFSKVMVYAYKCCKGIGYKKSTQNFKIHMFTNIATTCRKIKTNTYQVGNTYHFQINERGKIRDIDAPHIMDRLVHKTLANEVLIPLYTHHMVYDNGACVKGKGFIFCLERVKEKLRKYYRKYGLNGYVVTIDFSKFFQNISHEIIHDMHKKYIKNDGLIKVIEDYLFIGEGLALGVEMAQREACLFPNLLDHFLENNGCRVERYMDDTFFLCRNYKDAISFLEKYYSLANRLGIKINQKKTKIIPISHSFLFCKWKFFIDKKGKIKMIPEKSTIYR